MNASFPRIRIVLVEPEQPRNVGAVVRVAANFGLGDLYVVRASGSFSPEELRELHVASAGAVELVQLHLHTTLDAALRGSDVVVGSSGRMRDVTVPVSGDIRYFLPESIAPEADNADDGLEPTRAYFSITAIIFGRESKGLTTAEMAVCHGWLRLPVSPEFPSMNLSHAVTAVLCRALWFRDPQSLPEVRSAEVLPAVATHEVQEAWLRKIAASATSAAANQTIDIQQLRHLLHCARPSQNDMALLFNLLRLK